MSAIFISHSSHDNEAASEVRERLKEQGHRSIFLDFDPADGIPAGRSWEQELYARLKACQAIIVLCSKASMASDWVFAEITHAKALGKQVFPLKVEPCEIRSLLNEFQVLDLTADREDAYARLWRGLLVAGLDPKNVFDWDGSRPPYPGLLAFEEEDAAIFFGRDAEIREGLGLLRRLESFGGARWTAVLGASGSGKSSLVRAGLLPRLARDREAWLATRPFRPLGRPFAELARVLADAFEREGAARDAREIERLIYPSTGIADPGALVRLAGELRDAAGHRRASVLLALDQFEELLGYGTGDQETRFLAFLRSGVEDHDSPLRILATLRSDFLGELQTQPALHELDVETLTVGPMSADGFAQVIEGPAALAGIDLGPGLVQAMVEDTRTEDALPLLAFTLRELWEGYGEDGRLDVDDYRDKLGGLTGAVALAAEAVLGARRLSEREEADLRTAFLGMVRINEDGQYARRPARFSDLPESVHDVLERFVAGRLLVARGDGRESHLEVAHEALLRSWDRMVGWLQEDRAFLLWRRRLVEARREWERTERNSAALLRGPALGEAAGWNDRRRDLLGRKEQRFIDASVAAARRRRRWTRTGVAAAILVLLLFAATSHWQRVLTRSVMEMTHDMGILTHSRAMRREAPELASELLLELYNPELSVASLDLDDLHRKERVLGKSRDAMLVATAPPAGGVDVTLVIDKRWSVHLPHDSEVYKVAIEGTQSGGILGELRSPRGRHALTVADDRIVRLWELPEVETILADIRDAHLPRIPKESAARSARLLAAFDGHAGRVSHLGLSHDGRYAVSVSGKEVALWRTDSGAEPVLLGGHPAAVTAAAFDPESRRLLTTGADGDVLVFDLEDVFKAPLECTGHREGLVSGAFSLDGTSMLTLSQDGEIWWWQLATGAGKHVATANCRALAIAFADVSGAAILACDDGTARVFDVEAGGPMQVLK